MYFLQYPHEECTKCSFLSSGHGRKRTAVYNRPSCRPCVKCKKTNAIQVVPRHISGWSSVTSTADSCTTCWGDVLPMPSLLHSTKAVHFCGGWRWATYTEKENGQQCHVIGCEGPTNEGRGRRKVCVCVCVCMCHTEAKVSGTTADVSCT